MPKNSNSNQKKSLRASALAHVCQDGLDASTYVLLPILASAFGLSYAQIGAIKGAKSLALGALELASGFLSERWGESRVLITGLLIAGIGYAAVSFASTVLAVLVCLIILGIGGGLQHAPASALVSRTHDDHNRRSALGLYNSSGDVGKLLFTAGFSAAIGAGLAWQQVVLSYGALAILAAIFITYLSINYQTSNTGITNEDVNVNVNNSRAAKGWGVMNVSHFTILLIIVFLDNAVQVGVLLFVAFLMIANELPLTIATLATTLVLVGGVAGKAGCGFMAERIGVRRAFILVQILTAAGLIGVIVAPGWVAFALLLPLGVVSQGSTSITYGLLPDYIHTERMARGYSVLYSSTSIAAAAGAWLIGLSADMYGIDSAFLLMASISILALMPLVLSPQFARQSS